MKKLMGVILAMHWPNSAREFKGKQVSPFRVIQLPLYISS